MSLVMTHFCYHASALPTSNLYLQFEAQKSPAVYGHGIHSTVRVTLVTSLAGLTIIDRSVKTTLKLF